MTNSSRKIVFFSLLSLLSACGGGGEDGEVAGQIDQPAPVSYINWTQSSNGEAVLDATNDVVKFRADGGNMTFGSTTYSNILVDASGGTITLDGTVLGQVALIKSSTGGSVAAMVCTDGTLIDIKGTEASLTIGCSSVFALLIGNGAASNTGTTATALAGNWKKECQITNASNNFGSSFSCGTSYPLTVTAAKVPTKLPNYFTTPPAGSTSVANGITRVKTISSLTGQTSYTYSDKYTGTSTNYSTSGSTNYVTLTACGTCLVGSKIVQTIDSHLESAGGGLSNGSTTNPFSISGRYIYTYTRIN